MRYKDVTNRLVASPALPIDKKTTFDAVSIAVVVLRAYQRARCLCQVMCLLIVNVGAATGRLVLFCPGCQPFVPNWRSRLGNRDNRVSQPRQINVFVVVSVSIISVYRTKGHRLIIRSCLEELISSAKVYLASETLALSCLEPYLNHMLIETY